MKRKSIMKGLRLVWRTNATSSNTVQVLLFCVHTHPAWGRTAAHTRVHPPTLTLTCILSHVCTHTRALFSLNDKHPIDGQLYTT